MKPKHSALIILFTAAMVIVTGCAWIQTHQSEIQTGAKILAAAAQAAAPLVSNKQLSNSLYATSYVATTYGNEPVPKTVLEATAQIPNLANTVIPLVTGSANSPRTQAIINGSAAILAVAQPQPSGK